MYNNFPTIGEYLLGKLENDDIEHDLNRNVV